MISHPERYKGGISPQATNIHPQPDTTGPLVGGSSDKLAEQKSLEKNNGYVFRALRLTNV